MNTSGIQNYLSNVFRPIYTYDTTNSNFTPRLELSNIDVYSGNTVSVFTAAVGDSNSNVYVGSNAGNPFNITRACRSITALGFGAASNISNDTSSVYIGWYAGASGSNSFDVVSIGTNSGGNGSANIFVGTSTGTVGTSNIFIGHYINQSNVSNQIRIGYRNQIPIAADLSNNWVGIGGPLAPEFANNKLDVSGNTYIKGQLGINAMPGTRTLYVSGNFGVQDASANVLEFTGGLTRSSGGFASFQSNISVTGGVQTIGQIKKGIIHVCAIDQNSSANHSAKTYFAWTTSNVSLMSDISAGRTNITTSSTDIQITDASSTTQNYGYNITYFPLP